MKYTIGAKEFNAVMSCAGVENTRYYLNTFFIDADTSRMVATNGHVMGESGITPRSDVVDLQGTEKHGDNVNGFLFKAFAKPLLKAAETVVIDTEMLRAEVYGDRYKGPRFFALEPVDGRFPDYKRVSTRDLKPSPGEGVREIAFAPVYLYKPLQWAYLNNGLLTPVQVIFGEDNLAAMKVIINGLDTTFTLMPARIK